jgi:hypothetical protein
MDTSEAILLQVLGVIMLLAGATAKYVILRPLMSHGRRRQYARFNVSSILKILSLCLTDLNVTLIALEVHRVKAVADGPSPVGIADSGA